MKILLVNQTFYPDVVATAQHLTDAALRLKKDGHKVLVLTSRRGYSEPHPIYPSSETYQGVQVVRVWPFMFGRKDKLMRALDALCLNLAFFVRMLFLPRGDAVIALTSPPLVAFFACLVARFKKSHFVYWVMDMNPDEAIATGWIQETSWMTTLLKKCQRFVVRYSDRVVALDEYMKRRLIKADVSRFRNRGDLNKIVVIPPWAHDDGLQVVNHEDNPFRVKYGLVNKYVVMYSGNHSVCHPLDTVLDAARFLASDNSIVFMFIGGGARFQDVSAFRDKHSLANIIQTDYVARSEIKYSLSAADLHLVVMGDNMAGIVHPCKVYGILALGKPFTYVGPAESHIVDMIRDGVVGYSVKHGDVEKLASVIKHAQSMTISELERISKINRAIAKKFSADTLLSRFIEKSVEGSRCFTKKVTGQRAYDV